jgi:hypothetical protein
MTTIWDTWREKAEIRMICPLLAGSWKVFRIGTIECEDFSLESRGRQDNASGAPEAELHALEYAQ